MGTTAVHRTMYKPSMVETEALTLYNGHFGNRKAFCCTEVSTVQRLFYMHSHLSGPTKTVCYREVSAIGGICYKRLHCNCYQRCSPLISASLCAAHKPGTEGVVGTTVVHRTMH